MESTAKISKVWFESNRIYVSTDDGTVMSRPLEAFPILMDATDAQRLNYELSPFGDSLRWPELDEDIHISSFEQKNEPNPDNEVGRLFREFPWLNVSEVAKVIGINKSLLAKYIYGIKTPSQARLEVIKETLRIMGQRMMAVS